MPATSITMNLFVSRGNQEIFLLKSEEGTCRQTEKNNYVGIYNIRISVILVEDSIMCLNRKCTTTHKKKEN